jgi:hypothetical protein
VDVSELMGFPAVGVEGAEASPPETSAPEVVPDQTDAPADPQPVAPDPVDVEAVVQARLEQFQAEQQARAQQEEQARQAQIRLQMRQQEELNWQTTRKELVSEGLDTAAEKIQKHRSFLSQERDEAMMERDLMAKANDALVAILQFRHPDEFEEIVADAKTLLPYHSFDEMQGTLSQRANLTSAKDAEIARLKQQMADLQTQMGAVTRPHDADRVESGGTGIPVSTSTADPRKAQSLDEWAAIVNSRFR